MNQTEYATLIDGLHKRLEPNVRKEQTVHWAERHASLSIVSKVMNNDASVPLEPVIRDIKAAWHKQFDEIHIKHPMTGWLVTASYCKQTKTFTSAYYTNSTEMVIMSDYLTLLLQAEVTAAA